MPADTPAPDPVEALLREVDRANTDPRSYREDAVDPWLHSKFVQADAAPRLAAIVRILLEDTKHVRQIIAELCAQTCAGREAYPPNLRHAPNCLATEFDDTVLVQVKELARK